MWKPGKRKSPLETAMRRREDNIRMYLQGIGCDGMDWIDVCQDRYKWRALVNKVMNFRGP